MNLSLLHLYDSVLLKYANNLKYFEINFNLLPTFDTWFNKTNKETLSYFLIYRYYMQTFRAVKPNMWQTFKFILGKVNKIC